MPKFSLIVITKNEERSIARCLRSIDFADDVIVVDNGSVDRTVEIARANGARVVETADWPGYGPQKRRALDLAQGEWVLSLDADEWIDQRFGRLINEAINAPDAPAAYEMRRRSRFCGRIVRFGGWSSDYVVRLFRRERAQFSNDLVHEGLIVDGPISQIGVTIEHESIDSSADAEDKVNRYSVAAAQQMFVRGRRASYFVAPLHGWAAFIKVYVLRYGFLDGATGWHVAQYNRRHSAAKWRHLAEYSANQRLRKDSLSPTRRPRKARKPKDVSNSEGSNKAVNALFMALRIERAAKRTGWVAISVFTVSLAIGLFSLAENIARFSK
jgi:glycosyltransferase involved in cell wall biosynthesis